MARLLGIIYIWMRVVPRRSLQSKKEREREREETSCPPGGKCHSRRACASVREENTTRETEVCQWHQQLVMKGVLSPSLRRRPQVAAVRITGNLEVDCRCARFLCARFPGVTTVFMRAAERWWSLLYLVPTSLSFASCELSRARTRRIPSFERLFNFYWTTTASSRFYTSRHW